MQSLVAETMSFVQHERVLQRSVAAELRRVAISCSLRRWKPLWFCAIPG